jgi:hypothetical protein
MEMEAIRGMVARNPGPYRLQMADGSVVDVAAPEFMFLPAPSIRDARTIVIYGPDRHNFKLLDSLLIVAAEPVRDGGPAGTNGG